MATRSRSNNFENQRELILAQAARLFACNGYAATSMNEVAAACKVSKATLYHYVRDKHELLVQIAQDHVARLMTLIADVDPNNLAPEARLRQLITSFVRAYAQAQDQHRVLTEDIKFMQPHAQELVLRQQREVVAAFSKAVAGVRPELESTQLHKPLTMLLFGMINWTFTWLDPKGPLSYEQLAPMVADLFFGGLTAVRVPESVVNS